MLSQETLLELTESYLKSLVAETSSALGTDFDAAIPFGDLGIDSFRVLKIIKALEADFGTLPKTLLFENFNVEALARYFVEKHNASLQTRFSSASPASAPVAKPAAAVAVTPALNSATVPPATPAVVPILILEADLPRYPELEQQIAALYARYKNEGCVSRGTRNIAPNLFIGAARKGYFNYARSKNTLLIYAYTGPEEYFPEVAGEIFRYCQEKKFQLNIFGDQVLKEIAGVAFSATPFGALQRVLDIQSFTLEGGPMRRLRYQVSKFEKAGKARTEEYKCGSNPETDKSIAEVIDRWCAGKPMVNPLIHIVREEILAGSLHPQHRIFLTWLDERLENVILISAMNAELNGYLMDLEFYGKDMPLGGLEYAIVEMIGILAKEGLSMLSMGGTYGVRLEASEHADPEVDRILDDLHKQGIFNDEGNLQFKNKFRPENRTIYLCRPVNSGAGDNVIDLIMMIADPAKTQTSEAENQNAEQVLRGAPTAASATSATGAAAPAISAAAPVPATAALARVEAQVLPGQARSAQLAEYGFNPLNIPDHQVEFDFKTDSWAQLDAMPFVQKQMAHLRSQLQQGADLNAGLSAVFPFKYHVLTEAGRASDKLFCQAWPKKGVVLQNLLFPTCIYHQIDKGFTPREIPHSSLFRVDSEEAYKGNLDFDALQAAVQKNAAEIAYVCIELSDNGAGGQPVSIAHLQQAKQLLAAHQVALVIDATRVLENAQYLIENDAACAGKDMWQVAREMLSYADAVIGSLAKDFCVNRGGIIATNDENLARRLQELMQQEGGGLDVIEKKLVALSLHNRKHIETAIVRRMRAVQTIGQALQQAQVPLLRPLGVHCLLIDVKRLPDFSGFASSVPSFLAWLYLNTGIRAGAHSVGMQKDGPLNDVVRIAIPVGLKPEQVTDIAQRLQRAFAGICNIPELKARNARSESFGAVHDEYDLVCYHRVQEQVEQASVAPAAPAAASATLQAVSAVAPAVSAEEVDLAVIGMGGRYPQARNMTEFWLNLKEGRDCITEISADRLARRIQNQHLKSYRGGFVDDIDKFDSLFFNISPREAEVLDPQERLFLEVAWDTLEDAGYYPEILAQDNEPRQVGVFVGAVWAMYQIIGVEEKLAGNNVNPNSFLWSIANRVSFWMNLTGPSLTVDTACSSSLTALQLGCEAIWRGNCSSALVGGVNLDIHQHKFDINFAGGALSPDGLCRTFGAGANGYVAGEGAGAIFIKPLSKALADKDNIYGVIKSAVVNHGGRTSGYTVPNPKAQGDLVTLALQRAKVDARSISYVEAHGTGTELGDPVEISGLNRAFEHWQVAPQSCAIGSVKTNIGHLEAGAGVVGVCKVLLQMRYRQLVPSLHSAQLNELIDFANSPFYVQQNLQEWQAKEVDGVRQPLRAGVSSFGAGGANAHVVLEECRLPASTGAVLEGAYIFPLSARNEEQLLKMAQRLQAHLRLDFIDDQLPDIAFTLQNGRKSFEHRLALLANSKQDLLQKLEMFITGKKDAEVLSGHAKNAEGISKLLNRREKEQFIALLSQSRDPHKLAQLWIDGLLADSRSLQSIDGRRISLPTYPFADKRFWIGTGKAIVGGQTASALHPMIDSNESTFQRQIFRKVFHEHEFFLHDHIVSNVPTLPGVAYLDLARKAGELAAGRRVQKIKNVTWISPLTASPDQPNEALIELKPAGDSVGFEVFSEGADGKRKLYAQGKLVYAVETPVQDEYLDLKAILARSTKVVDGKQAYPLFTTCGLYYGPSFQVLQEVYKNGEEVLGRLQLPAARQADFEQFVLHPSIFDASMQAGVVVQLGDPSGEMKVPYSIGEVELLHPLTRTCYSYVTKMKSERNTGSGVSRENVTIVDENGKVLARIKESVGVPLVSVHEKPAAAAKDEQFDKLYYTHVWRASPLPEVGIDTSTLLLFDHDRQLRDACVARGIKVALVLPGSQFAELGEQIYQLDPQQAQDYKLLFDALNRNGISANKICYAWPVSQVAEDEAVLRQALDSGVYAFLYFCQALIEQKNSAKVQIVYLYSVQEGQFQEHNDAINGFARCLRLENPKIECKVLELRGVAQDSNQVLNKVLSELHASLQEDITVRYTPLERQTRTLKQLPNTEVEGKAAQGTALRQRGVYLITGGAGGLGLIFARFLARACQARLVLTGRSQLPPEREADLEQLRQLGAEVLYVAADASQEAGVLQVLRATRERFGQLHGIVHSAGVLRDSFLRKKTRAEMEAVLAPKVFGTRYLDQHTLQDDLDFFVTFSSLAAVGGNTGQCDYSYANHYMDSFAARREAQRAAGLRKGRSVSLNWSLWAEGGMKLDEQTELFFRKNLGIKPLATEFGVEAFANSLWQQAPQIAVLEGVHAKIEIAWGLVKPATPAVSAAATAPGAAAVAAPAAGAQGGSDLSKQVMDSLSEIVIGMLKLSADDLDLDSILLDLGFDSIGLTAFANAINDKYKLDLNPVLFFEYPSIRAIAGVLATDHGPAVSQVHGGGAAGGGTGPVAAPAPAAAVSSGTESISISKAWIAPAEHAYLPQSPLGYSRDLRFVQEPVAIVGMAGVMPQADTLEEFWEGLQQGRNLVTEIPRDRWIWEDYDGNPLKEPNKSYSRWGGFMREVDKFDPLFFGITPREAEMMDPQQRIFIEAVYKAIEDSGQKVADLSGTRTGLFVGASAKDYIDVLAQHQSSLDGYSASGNSHSILANRISYLFNLRGPSAPLDTACSSSLVALHRALESIHTGSSDMALVGGVQVMLTPVAHISLSAAGMLSTDGKCKTFNKDANGYVRGEGVGVVFLKTLTQAEADGNPIYAVIKATAENHGGRVTNLTAPNPKAQAELLTEAYEKAQLDPSTIGYIECHGTGTSLGDPIEIQALKKAFADLYKKHNKSGPVQAHCGLSSVKTNIGHLEPAAGMASLLKVLLALQHKQIPALLHFEELNPYIDLGNSPFYIVDKTVDWAAPQAADGSPLPRRAGVSSFGWGGANAHVVLEEYLPRARGRRNEGQSLPLILSAKNAERLQEYARLMLAHLEKHQPDFADFAYTLQVGRDVMNERLGFVANSREQAVAALRQFLAHEGSWPEGGQAGIYRGKAARKVEVSANAGQLIKDQAWDALLQYWVKGGEVDWSSLHLQDSYGDVRRLHVPTYPFARESYWIDTSKSVSRAAPAPVSAPAPSTAPAKAVAAVPEKLFFAEKWVPQAAPEHKALARKTLFFADQESALNLSREAGADFAGAIVVVRGDTCRQLDGQRWECRDTEEDLQQLLSQLSAGAEFDLVYCWASGGGQEGVHAIFRLLKVIKLAALPLVHLTLCGQYDVARAETCWDFAWTGFERSLKLYLAKTEIALLYAEQHTPSLAQILAAAHAGGAIWYKQGQRHVLGYHPLTPAAAPETALLKQGGAYLITGGCGALGMVFASYLAKQYRAKLLLTGRSAPSAAINAKIERLRAEGAEEVVYQALDLGDAGAVAQWAQSLPFALQGVIHAAGVESNQAFHEKSVADINQVLLPKTVGSIALDQALAQQALDFVCYFSSSSALLGDFGSCDYAIANRFQMAYGLYRRQQGAAGKTVVINWPLWQEGGMGISDPEQSALYLKRTGMQALSNADGLAIWNQLMHAEPVQTLVLHGVADKMQALLDKLYRVPKSPRPINLGHIAATPVLPAGSKLDKRQMEKLRQLIKADLLGNQEAEK